MDILWRKISHKFSEPKHNITQILLRTGIILVMGGISMAVPTLEPFIGLVGAIFFSILGLKQIAFIVHYFAKKITIPFYYRLVRSVRY